MSIQHCNCFSSERGPCPAHHEEILRVTVPAPNPEPTHFRLVFTIDIAAADFPSVTERVRSALLQHLAKHDGQCGEFEYLFDQTYDFERRRRHIEMMKVRVENADVPL